MRKTVLNPLHRDLDARLVEFGGFEMPVRYRSIVEEHQAVRTGAGIFDLCHMGRFEVRGADAVAAVDHVVTNNVASMRPGRIRYALVLNDEGGVLDDIPVYRMPESILLVVNASNRGKLLAWFAERFQGMDAELADRSEELAMIAVQGPGAEALLSPVTDTTWVESLAALGYYCISDARIALGSSAFEGWVSRTGYTGEDGFEIYLPGGRAVELWRALQERGGERLLPCGLGCRDTLRLEAGMPLYGHELDEETNPLEAGLRFAVKLKKPAGFIGADALRQLAAQAPRRRLRGFLVEGKRVARQGMAILSDDGQVGRITSGAPSPTLGRNIAIGYVSASLGEDVPLDAEVRGHRIPLTPHSLPFYKRPED